MKIKHWQGYGVVNATKVQDKDNILIVDVKGNHECGLERNDKYDVFNWLVKRFTKKCESYTDIIQILTNEYLEKTESGIVECCRYMIGYKSR